MALDPKSSASASSATSAYLIFVKFFSKSHMLIIANFAIPHKLLSLVRLPVPPHPHI